MSIQQLKIRVPNLSDLLLVILLALMSAAIFFWPSEFNTDTEKDTLRVKVSILETNNELVVQTGIIKTGTQQLTIRILEGRFSGKEIQAANQLMGRMEFDKFFIPGDKALTVLNMDKEGGTILSANVVDHYRLNVEIWLLLLFIIFLIGFAGWIGLKAILSFIFAGLSIWKILLPGFLHGYNPILLSLFIVCLLTGAIIFLVAGITRKGAVAFLGSMSGVGITCMMALIFGSLFNIHGAIKPFSETLLYSGFSHLDLTDIFLAGIFISSSGAVMDIAMDIAASQAELYAQNPGLSSRQLIKSGFSVGRAIVGTMTTTLLLAYSGGFSALLMVFIAQGTPMVNILNLNYVSGEILHTLVGSFGLVLVAPLTAIIGGWIFARGK